MHFSLFFGRRNTDRRTFHTTRWNRKRPHSRRPTLERLENRSLLAGFPIGLGGTGFGEGRSVATDAAGNVFVAGAFGSGTIDFDPGPGTANLNTSQVHGYLAKYTVDGTFAWVRRFGATNANAWASSVVVDPAGNAHLAGIFKGTASITGIDRLANGSNVAYTSSLSLKSHNKGKSLDELVVKFDPSGSVQWAKQFGGDQGNVNDSYRNSLAIHTDAGSVDGVYVTGRFSGTVDFNPATASTANLTSVGLNDAFAVKLNGSGDFGWAIRAGSTGDDFGAGIAVAADGNVYVTGGFVGSNPFGSNFPLTSQGGQDGFVAKLNTNGTVNWVQRMGGAALDAGRAIRVTADSVYVAGNFETVAGGASFGSQTLNGFGGLDAYASRLNATDGTFQWTRHFGGPGEEHGYGLAIDATNNLYVTGGFQNTVDFDPGLNDYSLTADGGDGYVTKLDADGNFGGWATRLGDGNRSVSWDPFSNTVIATGTFYGTLQVCTRDACSGPTLTNSNNTADVFVAQLDVSTGLPPVTVNALRAAGPAPTDTSDGRPAAASTSVDAALMSILYDLDDSATRKRKKGA